MAWSADQYLKFAAPRLQPALDLLARVPDALQPSRVVDLGCGTGSATQRIAARWPRADVTGVDDSAEAVRVQALDHVAETHLSEAPHPRSRWGDKILFSATIVQPVSSAIFRWSNCCW